MTSTQPQILVYIRWIMRYDVPEVLEIEKSSSSQPWDEEELIRRLRDRGTIGMVAEYGSKVVGFMVYELHKHRLQLIKLVVHPSWSQRGVGSQMVEKMISKLNATDENGRRRRRKLTIQVSEWNTPAHLFLRSQGFRATKVVADSLNEEPGTSYQFEYLPE
jgi:ribosomal-protein-alanine N-acetyltransferase